jgi:hypothetical protein
MRRSIFGTILFMMASLVAFGQAANSSDPAQDKVQDHKELQQLDRNAHQDKQAAQNELNDVNKDRAEMKSAVKDGDKAEAKKDSQDLRQDKNALSQDKRGIEQDMQRARQIRQSAKGMGPRVGGRR